VSWLRPRSSRRARICAAVAALSAVPASMLVAGFSAEAGFLRFLVVGRVFEARALPELREARPPLGSEHGYDGQFYAQLALDPTLRRPELRQALDGLAYRSRRIGLPVLAHLLGFGRPAVVLQIYALLNFAFWAALLAAFLRHVGLERPRDFLLAAALLWNTGALVSLQRALTDFPAVALGVVAVWQTSRKLAPAGLLSAACLVKETSILQILAVGWPERERGGATRHLVTWALMLLPVAVWVVYLWWNLAEPALPARGQITLPFVGLATKLLAAGNDLREAVRGGNLLFPRTFELLAPTSLALQAIYLLRYSRLSSRAWRFGAGFAALLPFLGNNIWAEQYAFCRILLPLTAAFNLLVHEHEERATYARWFFAGNVGMIWMFVKVLRD
jgi:hypothetical protein